MSVVQQTLSPISRSLIDTFSGRDQSQAKKRIAEMLLSYQGSRLSADEIYLMADLAVNPAVGLRYMYIQRLYLIDASLVFTAAQLEVANAKLKKYQDLQAAIVTLNTAFSADASANEQYKNTAQGKEKTTGLPPAQKAEAQAYFDGLYNSWVDEAKEKEDFPELMPLALKARLKTQERYPGFGEPYRISFLDKANQLLESVGFQDLSKKVAVVSGEWTKTDIGSLLERVKAMYQQVDNERQNKLSLANVQNGTQGGAFDAIIAARRENEALNDAIIRVVGV